MKARNDRLADSTWFHEGDKFWLHRPTRTRGTTPKAAAITGRPVQSDRQDQRLGSPDPATTEGEDGGGTPGQATTTPWRCSGRAVPRREQCDEYRREAARVPPLSPRGGSYLGNW
jgi:hypothetical protein